MKCTKTIQTYYLGELLEQKQAPVESDHKLIWMDYDSLRGRMFLEMQNWALKNSFTYVIKDGCKRNHLQPSLMKSPSALTLYMRYCNKIELKFRLAVCIR